MSKVLTTPHTNPTSKVSDIAHRLADGLDSLIELPTEPLDDDRPHLAEKVWVHWTVR